MGVANGRLAIHPPGAPVSPLGYGIWADSVGLVLDRLHTEVPGVPLLVAEAAAFAGFAASGKIPESLITVLRALLTF